MEIQNEEDTQTKEEGWISSMIKAKYYYKGDVVGTVKFQHDRQYQPLNERDIIAAAPVQWDSCCWDHGEIVAPRRKRVPTVEEIVTEPVIHEDE